MRHRLKKQILKLLLSSALIMTGFSLPAIDTQAKETLTFTDEQEVSEFIHDWGRYEGKSLRTVGSPWIYDATYRAIHLQDGIYSPTPANPGPKFEDLTGSDSFFNLSDITVETDYNWNVKESLSAGQHLYTYEMKEGDIMPVSKWVYSGNPTAIHHVSNLDELGTHVTGNWYNYAGVVCFNDIVGDSACDVTNGKWYETVQYKQNAVGIYGFHDTVLRENYIRNGEFLSTTLYDYPAWRCVCAICGEYLTNVYFETPAELLSDIKYIEIDTHVITKCRGCGALENEGHTHHSCKAISDNRYTILYDDGTNDPNVYGSTKNTVFYANNALKYEGATIVNSPFLSKSNFTRPGYTFLGWSLEDDGTVDYTAGADIYTLEFYKNYLANPAQITNDDTFTLYACWGAEASIVEVDANTNNIWGNSIATVFGVENYTQTNTMHQGREIGSDNKAYDKVGNFQNNSVTLHLSEIVTPSGYQVSFDTGGGGAVPMITETTKIIGYTRDVLEDTSKSFIGTQAQNISSSYDTNGYLQQIQYKYTKAPCREKITLAYESQGITLPNTEKAGSLFVGWYTTADYQEGTFVGSGGTFYYPQKNITLYARFSEVSVDISDVYYSTDTPLTYDNVAMTGTGADNAYSTPNSSLAVNYAKGALNLHADRYTPAGTTVAFKTYYKQSATNTWKLFDGNASANGNVVPSYDLSFLYTPTGSGVDSNGLPTQTYAIQSTGWYKLTALGAQEQSSGTTTGYGGGETSGQVYLKKGEVVTVTAGRAGSKGITSMETGGYTSIWKTGLDGKKELLMTAGGGSGTRHTHTHIGNSSTYGGCYGPTTTKCYGQIYTPYGSHYEHRCRSCGYVSRNYTLSGLDATPGQNCNSHESGGHDYVNASGNKEYLLSCGLQEQTNPPVTHPYDTGNYINTSLVRAGSSVNQKRIGHGYVRITSLIVGLQDGNDSHTEVLGIQTPDLAPPSKVVLTKTEKNNIQTVTWEEPKSNGTNYDVKFEEYQVTLDTSVADGLKLIKATDPVTKTLTSAIAGYYYLYNNNSSFDIRNYVNNVLNYHTNYTWSNQHCTGVSYTQGTSLTIGNNPSSYLHIAAVDVAGNIGATTTLETLRTRVGTVVFHSNPLEYQLKKEEEVPWLERSKLYAIEGTDVVNTNKGYDGINTNLSFGGDFPEIAIDGCHLLGWNSNPEGRGTWYSKNGTGDGLRAENAKTLSIREMTNKSEAGQSVHLYAIWEEKVENTVSAVKTKNAISITNQNIKVSPKTIHTNEVDDWVTQAGVKIVSKAPTGPYILSTHLDDYRNSNPLGTLDFYTPGSISFTKTVYKNLIGGTVLNGNTTEFVDESLFYKTFTLDENIYLQGSFRLYSTVTSRQGNTKDSENLLFFIDSTPVQIEKYSIAQEKLQEKYATKEEAEAGIQSGEALTTTFTVHATDYAEKENGLFIDKKDTSGIQGVYITFSSTNYSVTKEMTLQEGSIPTTSGTSVIEGIYKLSIDLTSEFPEDEYVSFRVTAIDRAGNVGKTVFVSDMDNPNFDGEDQISGVLRAFDIATYIENTFSPKLTINGTTYFLPGDEALITTYTVGFAQSVRFDFQDIGRACVSSIKSGSYAEEFNMGVFETGYERGYTYQDAKATKVACDIEDVNGIPYATKYEDTLYIFPYVTFPDKAKTRTETYTAQASKKTKEGEAMIVSVDREYVIYTSSEDIHYRSY